MSANPLCPMCRGPVDLTIFNNPSRRLDIDMVDPDSPSGKKPAGVKPDPDGEPLDTKIGVKSPSKVPTSYWLYEGRFGWWRFDPRCEKDIEAAMVAGMPMIELCVCGGTYILDFTLMIQYKKNMGIRHKRNIMRVDQDVFIAMKDQIKGIAGMAVSQ